MSDRRFFTSRQHVALALGAEGRCQRCGDPLEPGWHADHVLAHSRGGPTRLANGQALCPRCNLAKGSKLIQDSLNARQFQRELHTVTMARVAGSEIVTVANVSPGSGKTLAYQWIATDLMRRELIDFAAIYTPRISLATQAETSYRREESRDGKLVEVGDYELFQPIGRLERIRHRRNSYPILPPAARREAFVTCFASLTANPDLHLDWAREHEGRFLLVADEAQFCGADDSPGEEFGGTKAGYYIEQMAQYARHTLLLTGTPYRADGKKLVLADYVEGGDGRLRLVAHAEARYRDGIGARPEPYLRRFEMSLTDIHVTLVNNADETTYEDQTSNPDLYRYMESLKPVLRRPDVWQPVADNVVSRLRFVQRLNPEYRALIACMEKTDARHVYDYLRAQYPGLRVEVALSDDGPVAETALRKFRTEKADVLVTVRMAFLGYDCAKITVVGVLTNYRDPGHLMQLIGRGLRVWKLAESNQAAKDQRCHIVTTDDPKMRRFLDYLKREQDEGIKEREDGTGGGGSPSGDPDPWVVTDAFATKTAVESEAGPVGEDQDLLQAVLHGIGPITTVSQLAEAAEMLALLKRGEPQLPIPGTTRAPKTEQEIVKECKSQASEAIGAHLRRLGHETSDGGYQRIRARITRDVNRAFGVNSTEAITTKEQARGYLSHVRSWVAER